MKLTTFNIILLAVFGLFIIIGVIAFSTYKAKDAGSGVPVTVWGTASSGIFQKFVSDVIGGNKAGMVQYSERSAATFEDDVINALASGKGPDVILLPEKDILRFRDKVMPIPYTTLKERDFRDTYIGEGELYLMPEGVLAVPFSIDPLVMYWNRSYLANVGVATPPRFWDEFFTFAENSTTRSATRSIIRSAVGLGEYRNITNAKEIISALTLQTGNSIVALTDGAVKNSFSLQGTTESAINFYTEFANPLKPDFTWSRALPTSKQMFAAGDLALYFGFASERPDIRAKNPNLNFDVVELPQIRGAKTSITYGRMTGFAISRASQNATDALALITALTSADAAAKWSAATGLPPVRRDLLSGKPSDIYQAIFYRAALQAESWLDPNPPKSAEIFQNMIEGVTGGRARVSESVARAAQELDLLLR